jgi:mannan endo-1,4-beta-mannosidase
MSRRHSRRVTRLIALAACLAGLATYINVLAQPLATPGQEVLLASKGPPPGHGHKNAATPTPTPTSTATPTPTPTPAPTATPTPTPTSTPTPTTSPTPPPSGFVGRSGTHLVINGSVVTLLGYNAAWVGFNCGGWDAATLDTVFSDIAANSKGTLVRVGMYQTTNTPWATFDLYVSEAAKYQLRILPMLTNTWGDCDLGGQKYLPWYSAGGYTTAGDGKNDGLPLSYRDYAVQFAQHFANNSTIAWYQLVNEPDARNSDGTCSESTAASALRSFADTMTAAIKAADPNHMVDLGSISWCGGQGSDFGYVMAGAVDLCDAYHDYGSPAVSMPSTELSHLTACLSSDGKPAIDGETGICADVGSSGSCTGTITATTELQRATFLQAKIQALLAAGGSGYLIWQKGHNPTTSYGGGSYFVGTCGTVSGCVTDPTAPMMAALA